MRRDLTASRVDDATLVQQAQGGDVQAFAALVLRYQDRVFNTCWRVSGSREDAADLTQDAFLKAFRALGTFGGKSSFYTWLFRIAVNLALTHKKRARLRLVTSLDDDAGGDACVPASAAQRVPDEKGPSPAAAAEEAERHRMVADALARIDAHHRVIVVLRDIEGLDYQRIAEVMDVPVGTVKSRVYRARTALRNELERMMGDDPTPTSDKKDEHQRPRQTC